MLRRRLNQAGGVLLLLLALILVAAIVARAAFAPSFPGAPNIAHAGGALEGRGGTNSVAALQGSVAKGFRYLEIDFQTTSDGVVVCGHDWDDFADVPDLDTVLAARGPNPPCTVDELAGWMAANPGARLVSDAKEDALAVNAMLRERLGDRLLPQAYSAAEAHRHIAGGSPGVILTLYRLDGPASVLRELDAVAELGDRLEAVTMPPALAFSGLALWAKLRLGRPVYVHTINDCLTAGLLWAVGVDAVYTDTLGPGSC